MGQFDNIVGDDLALANMLGADVSADDLPGGFAGLTPTAVGAGVTSNIAVPLNAYLRPDRLIFNPAFTVDLCYLVDIKVGTISLNVGSQPAAAVAFKHDAIGSRLRAAVTGNPSVPPVVVVQNGTGGSITVAGTVLGPVQRA